MRMLNFCSMIIDKYAKSTSLLHSTDTNINSRILCYDVFEMFFFFLLLNASSTPEKRPGVEHISNTSRFVTVSFIIVNQNCIHVASLSHTIHLCLLWTIEKLEEHLASFMLLS